MKALRSQKFMEAKGIPMTRWLDAAGEAGGHRAAVARQGDDGVRPRRQHRHPHAGNARRAGGAGPVGGGDPHPTTFASVSEEERDAIAADLHPVRGGRVAYRVQPLDPVGRPVVEPIFELKNDYDVMYALATARLRAEMFSGSRWSTASRMPKTSCGKSIRLALRPGIRPVAERLRLYMSIRPTSTGRR